MSQKTVTAEFGATRQPFLDRYPWLWIAGALAITALIFLFATDFRFLSESNINAVLMESAQLLIIAIPVTYLIATGNFDISVGSTLILASVLAADVMAAVGGTAEEVSSFQFPNAGLAIAAGCVAGIGFGAVMGAINGFLVAYLKLPSLIVTLATMGAYQGVALIITNGTNRIHVPPVFQREFGFGGIAGVSWLVIIALVVALIGWYVLGFTRTGVRTLAIGSNIEGSRRAGIDVKRHVFGLYVVTGTAAGLSGLMDLARFASTSLEGHQLDALDAISAVILGGTSLLGGIANIPGTVIGSLLPGTLQNGFIQLHIPPFWQPVALGVVLLLAIGYDTLRRRR